MFVVPVHPVELPAHAFAILVDLRERGIDDRDERHVARRQVNTDATKGIGPQRVQSLSPDKQRHSRLEPCFPANDTAQDILRFYYLARGQVSTCRRRSDASRVASGRRYRESIEVVTPTDHTRIAMMRRRYRMIADANVRLPRSGRLERRFDER